jgi:HSP20 family protein
MTKGEVTVHTRQSNETDETGLCRVPAADIYETPDAYVVKLDLPGVEKEGIALTLDRGELKVQARAADQGHVQGRLLFNEMRGGTFARSFAIGDGIDTNSIDAQFEKGVLTVKLYKHELMKPREISIN